MNFILSDGSVRNNFLPFTFTRPVADIRIGILTLRQKWEKHLNASTSSDTENYLSEKFPLVEVDKNIKIDASFIPTENLAGIVKNLKENQAVFYNDYPIAYFYTKGQELHWDTFDIIQYTHNDILKMEHLWDIFKYNGEAIALDFKLLTKGRISQPIPETVHCINKEHIFLEEGASVVLASLNATEGPIYIGKDAEIMEACAIRGPFALCEHATLKMGTKIYGPTTVGPHSKVGGEVTNSVIFGYSNKGHDGFLGNSVIGEWCNLGADTNNSNLKNNYAEVRLWNYQTGGFTPTGLQFCGLMMGDHSKCGINTMFNTGTVVGVSANIFGSGFPRNFIPSFSWGGSAGLSTYKTDKAFEVAKAVMSRRNMEFNEEEAKILTHVFEETAKWRKV
ncbi:MAG: glucose-1-phosphate thymidylyltransferase [Flavobacteriaceae bacterium CG18_big_fil_WC_8_21_14_2_50_34_36]|nr:MAG: glucose-1-phosphate thymidylyltransferase [Flavobacteriaceae bacterium CG18_big_fil_WC_8_21_14_2_50_34_36]PIV48616.1 MAG: glucose-1-phosphate thymidylyltransferase [Flavobacteriaceae bacterium CG02_land_8_20_14_3_00_34_13]PIZ07069.1 MAG: glucose-1-phosphate thymidylyltransferase [Flavobacteriaceae bacterium CG_4_10_14_0_8_um_filter_34_31]PJC07342.1 MAG: glucose-1-phosphate thymidylyltransferase [Flavobacteriaceae bacterium CG_4_9_14_0_8_um_filter_34_30]